MHETDRSDKSNTNGNCGNLVDDILGRWIGQREKIVERNHGSLLPFSPLKILGLLEIQHSRLIGDLLNPAGSHGQGALFLEVFLDELKMEHSPADKWIVTVEDERVDILMRRSWPQSSIVIVENKINDAMDQPNQLYRYWYSRIYLADQTSWAHCPNKNQEEIQTPHRLVYLSSSGGMGPSEQSLLQPMELSDACPFQKVPMRVSGVSMRALTERWLCKVRASALAANPGLISFLEQYHQVFSMNEIVEEAHTLFGEYEKWRAMCEISANMDSIVDFWLETGAEKLREKFSLKPATGWKCYPWGAKRDTRWYLEDLGKESIGFGVGWPRVEFHLHLEDRKGCYDIQSAIKTMRTKERFRPLLEVFKASEPANGASGCICSNLEFYPFCGETKIGRERINAIAWWAKFRTDFYVETVLAAVDQIIANAQLTELIRELNSLAKRA